MDAPNDQDRRSEPRQRVLLGGNVRFSDFFESVGCTIRDVSASGARIVLDSVHVLPGTISLAIPARDRRLRAHVAWRNGTSAGLRFEHIEEYGRGGWSGPASIPPAARRA